MFLSPMNSVSNQLGPVSEATDDANGGDTSYELG
jgi:hypothetical protein